MATPCTTQQVTGRWEWSRAGLFQKRPLFEREHNLHHTLHHSFPHELCTRAHLSTLLIIPKHLSWLLQFIITVHVRPQPFPVGATQQVSASRSASTAQLTEWNVHYYIGERLMLEGDGMDRVSMILPQLEHHGDDDDDTPCPKSLHGKVRKSGWRARFSRAWARHSRGEREKGGVWRDETTVLFTFKKPFYLMMAFS